MVLSTSFHEILTWLEKMEVHHVPPHGRDQTEKLTPNKASLPQLLVTPSCPCVKIGGRWVNGGREEHFSSSVKLTTESI